MAVSIRRRSFLSGVGGALALAAVPGAGFARTAFGPAPGVIKLNANENPYGPSPKALEAIAEAATRGAYYPGPTVRRLREMVAEHNDLTPEHVVLTSGSIEALFAVGAAYSRHGRIVAPALTFDPHLRVVERTGGEVIRIPLTTNMDTDLAAMERAVDNTVSMVYVCNPNNPTGEEIDAAALRAFCNRLTPTVTVMVDEAYNELTDDPVASSMVDLVRRGDNVIITRTFSKLHGIAGLRVGYALAPPHLAEVVARHAMTQPNLLGAAAAIASIDDEAFLNYSKRKIREGRELVSDVFRRHEVPYVQSRANFVYGNIGRDAEAFRARMQERNVYIRGIYAPYTTWSRVSMGRMEDLEVFARVFSEVYGA